METSKNHPNPEHRRSRRFRPDRDGRRATAASAFRRSLIVGGSSVIGMVIWMQDLSPNAGRPPVHPAAVPAHRRGARGAHGRGVLHRLRPGDEPAVRHQLDGAIVPMVFAFIGPALYSLTALGLFYRVPLAGFVAWFIFIGPGVAEFTHFIFPLLEPAIRPELAGPSRRRCRTADSSPTCPTTGSKRPAPITSPGMYTAILPMIPGIWTIVRTIRAGRAAKVSTRIDLARDRA